MLKMNERSFREYFEPRPVFTSKQVSASMGRDYDRVYLNRLLKKGTIIRIGRGVYSFHHDPFIYASHIEYPSYISFLSAMQYHGLTTQVPILVEVVAPRKGAYLKVDMVGSRYLWGYSRSVYGGFEVFIADKEKAAIDGILHGRLTLEHIRTLLEASDTATLEEMVLRLGMADMKRVGYVCDLQGLFLKNVHEGISADRNYVRSIHYRGPNRWMVRP